MSSRRTVVSRIALNYRPERAICSRVALSPHCSPGIGLPPCPRQQSSSFHRRAYSGRRARTRKQRRTSSTRKHQWSWHCSPCPCKGPSTRTTGNRQSQPPVRRRWCSRSSRGGTGSAPQRPWPGRKGRWGLCRGSHGQLRHTCEQGGGCYTRTIRNA